MVNGRIESSFISLCKKFKVPTAVEIGAHEASFSISIRALPFIVSVIAFEANPFVWKKFRPIIDKSIDYRNQAVSDKSGPVTFYIQQNRLPSETLNNSLLKRADHTQAQEITVESVTLDELLPIISPAALWIDVEGSSREVLLGGKEFLAETALVFLEVEHQSFWQGQWLFQDIIDFFETEGFLLHSIKEETINQTNCIFINPTFCHDGTLSRLSLKLRHVILPRLMGVLVWRAKKDKVKSRFYRGYLKTIVSLVRRFKIARNTIHK